MKSSRSLSGTSRSFFVVTLVASALVAACAGGMNISGKTPIVGTIRLDPTASCPVPPPASATTATAAATHTSNAGNAVKK